MIYSGDDYYDDTITSGEHEELGVDEEIESILKELEAVGHRNANELTIKEILDLAEHEGIL